MVCVIAITLRARNKKDGGLKVALLEGGPVLAAAICGALYFAFPLPYHIWAIFTVASALLTVLTLNNITNHHFSHVGAGRHTKRKLK